MQEEEKQILRDILTLIGYKDDKEAFVEDFFTTSKYEAMTNFLQTLPKDRLDELEQKLLQGVKEASVKAIIFEYVTPEKYEYALKQTIAENMKEFVATVTEALKNLPAEKEKLAAYLQSRALPLLSSTA